MAKHKCAVVTNLSTLEERVYTGITPKQAAIAACAQSQGDYNTWDYEQKYRDKVVWGRHAVSCGDWCVLL